MAAEVEGAANKPHTSTFAGNGLQYNYDAELAAVLPFNVKIPFDNVAEARPRRSRTGWPNSYELEQSCPRTPTCSVRDHVLPAAGGSSDLPIRIYTPARRTTSLGALVFFHGGGYVLGTLDNEELRCVHYARGSIAWSSAPTTALLQSTRSRRLLMIAIALFVGLRAKGHALV